MLSEKAPQHHIKHNHLVVLGFFSAFIGVFLFANGFLLTRSELTNITNTSSLQPSDFQQVILILVDGLYTGLLPLTNESEKMPFFKNLIHQQGFPRNHFLAHFIADPPTTTLQRLKALLTGSMPTFIDAGSNFGGTELQEDNILKQWALAGKNICFVGDQVWTELVSDVFLESFPLPAFNIKDLDTVDTAVKDYVLREVGSGKCDVLIGHMLGIDHCGHTFGRSHPEMDRKLLELDGFLKRLIAHLTPSSLLVVFGDHGMTASGDHGGDSDAEVDAALFVYTPRGFPRVRDASIDDGSPLPSIEQVDLVPTLASLTGVSIPFSNLGVVATTLLNSSHLLSAVNANFRQVVTYAKEYHDRFGTISTPEAMVSRLAHNSTTPCPAASIDECLLAMRSLRASFRTHWTRMDVPRMALGLLFTLHALLAFVAYDNNLPVPGPVWCVAATLAAASLVALTPLGSFLLALLPSYRLAAVWLSSKDLSPSRGTLLTGTLLVVLALTSCSNSFVVQEARVLGFVLQTLLLAASLFATTEQLRESLMGVVGLPDQQPR
ncbi:unnamed protein product [Mesocestoides corti]|uniref:Uncharacterized protein n=1 Tax=Mesocestoides corti TaxID=53468 RepID=A0A0R3UI05_MESCO|nr:unnamed protein product [Mesocestoides corti]